MDGVHENGGMLLNLLCDLVASHLGIGNARYSLPCIHQSGALLGD